MRRGRAHAALLAAPIVLVVLLLAVPALVGCGGGKDEGPPPQPFGTPPAAQPGVRAWAAGEVGTLLVTADGGHSWRRQRFYLSQRGLDVAFTDAQTGWLVTDGGDVLRTTDGGASWNVVEASKLQLKAVATVDASTAWVVATAGSLTEPGRSLLLRTTDGGTTWQRASGAFGGSELGDVAFADRRHGVLVALDRVWVTRDGGRSWQLSRQQGMSVLTSVCPGDASTAWVAGWGTQDGAPFVLATNNGGQSWRKLKIRVRAPASGPLQAGQLVSAGAGLWLTCTAGVLVSRDAGRTWELQQTPALDAGRPAAIAAADEQHLVATTSGQPVLATSDGGATWLAFGNDGLLKQPLVAIAAVAAPAGE